MNKSCLVKKRRWDSLAKKLSKFFKKGGSEDKKFYHRHLANTMVKRIEELSYMKGWSKD